MSNHESDLSLENMLGEREVPGPFIVSDKDKKKLEWMHGTSFGELEVNIQLSTFDVAHLVEHVFLNMFNLMFGSPLDGEWTENNGAEQIWNWRLINLIIKSNEKFKDGAKEIFIEICRVFDKENDNEILGLFDRYVM